MIRLFIINGEAESGKDTFVKAVKKEYALKGYMTANLHSSDRAKAALKMMNWSGVKTKESRRLLAELCDFGQLRGVSKEIITRADSCGYDIIFFHERNPEQINILLQTYPGAKTILVSRPGHMSPEEDQWNINSISYDITVVNTSIDSLEEAAKSLVAAN